ncbi:MAG TPA: hypothetical protein VGH57_00945 [Amycolatopsis sp.]
MYAAPGQHIDLAAAERVVGNRRLVIGFLDGGTDLAAACHTLTNAAPDTIAVLLSPKTDDFDHYTCSRFPGAYDANFGKSFVAESKIADGIGGFSKQPLNAVKTIVVNYDQLVRSSTIPDGSRTITPSLPRYLIAIAALATVIAGAAGLYFAARRAAVATDSHHIHRTESDDEKATLSSSAAVLAQEIIDLDSQYARADQKGPFARKYRQLASDYANLLPQLQRRRPVAHASGGATGPGAEAAREVSPRGPRAVSSSPTTTGTTRAVSCGPGGASERIRGIRCSVSRPQGCRKVSALSHHEGAEALPRWTTKN